MSVFLLPDLGEGLAEAAIVVWHVQPGDEVSAGQLLVSVETAKAVVDVPSPQTGRVVALLAAAGSTVPTHAPLVEFAAAGPAPIAPPPAATPLAARDVDAGSVVGQLAQAPALRHEDFLIGRHRQGAGHPPPRARSPSTSPPPLFAGGDALDATRQFMADTMTRADRDVVRVTLTDEADLAAPASATLTARLVRALVAAARQQPALNAWYDAAARRRLLHDAVHVGVAVDTPHGLYVPVLRNAATLSLEELVTAIAQLRQAALDRRLSHAQLAGATLTLSNFGAIGGRFATPVVTPPQVAILGAGRAQDLLPDPADVPGRPRRQRLPLSLSFDHRVVTGGEASRFLQAVIRDLGLA